MIWFSIDESYAVAFKIESTSLSHISKSSQLLQAKYFLLFLVLHVKMRHVWSESHKRQQRKNLSSFFYIVYVEQNSTSEEVSSYTWCS